MSRLRPAIITILLVGFFTCCMVAPACGADFNFQAHESKVVNDFMSLMIERQRVNSTDKDKIAEIDSQMMSLLAPYYFETMGVDKNLLTINRYSPDGFRIIAVNDNYVFVKLSRKSSNWPIHIVFKVAEYKGSIYIEPSSVGLAGNGDPSLVTPWFYAAEKPDLPMEKMILPDVEKPRFCKILPVTKQNAESDGVAIVKKLINYTVDRKTMSDAQRKLTFKNEVLPYLAKGYTDIYGVVLDFYEDITIDEMKNYKISVLNDSYIAVGCSECLYDTYVYRLVAEDGRTKIMPTGIDNYKKTIYPVWRKE